MKSYLVATFMLLSSLAAIAQTWVTDFDNAKQLAQSENKTIIMVFQGSDWCVPCMKLDREIWSSEAFIEHADKKYVMLQVDFPKRKANKLSEDQEKKNKVLAEKFNKKGYFPYVVVLDKEGKVLGSTGYKKISPEDYIKLLDAFIVN